MLTVQVRPGGRWGCHGHRIHPDRGNGQRNRRDHPELKAEQRALQFPDLLMDESFTVRNGPWHGQTSKNTSQGSN